MAKNKKRGVTIFFTGLPSSGKSTIAKILYTKLSVSQKRKVALLDADIIRQTLSKGLGFSKKDRNINIARIGSVAKEITKCGNIVICAAIAPYKKARLKNRKLISKYGDYIEVFVNTPIEICKKRDVKGLYKKAEIGQLKNLTGIDDPYEIPENPEINLITTKTTPAECAEGVIKFIQDSNLI